MDEPIQISRNLEAGENYTHDNDSDLALGSLGRGSTLTVLGRGTVSFINAKEGATVNAPDATVIATKISGADITARQAYLKTVRDSSVTTSEGNIDIVTARNAKLHVTGAGNIFAVHLGRDTEARADGGGTVYASIAHRSVKARGHTVDLVHDTTRDLHIRPDDVPDDPSEQDIAALLEQPEHDEHELALHAV